MPGILVIGYGNTLRGDDGFGPLAAQLIAARSPPDVAVLVVHQLGPELAPDIGKAGTVVFLDAAAAGEPGRLTAAAVAPHDLSATTISHSLAPGSLLALTRAVYGAAPAATLVTAAASSFAHGDALSPAVRAAAEKVADVIVRLADTGRLDAEALRAAWR